MAAVHFEHVVLVISLKDLKWAIVGVLQWAAVGIMVNIHITSGCQVCRLHNSHELHMRVEGQFACCLGAAREIWRTLANPVAHGE